MAVACLGRVVEMQTVTRLATAAVLVSVQVLMTYRVGRMVGETNVSVAVCSKTTV